MINGTTHCIAPVCMCVFVRAGEKRVRPGHSQESLIWTGSAAAGVMGHGLGLCSLGQSQVREELGGINVN